MDIRKYQLFVDIAETGNLTRSAERLGYTQSGVSHTLKSLEEDLGFPLFVRKKRGVYLTETGKVLLPAVRAMLQGNERIEQMVAELNSLQTGTVRIGSYASISAMWLPPIIRDFSQDYPGIVIQIQEGNVEAIERMLREGTVEFAFLSYRSQQDFQWIPMHEDELLAILPLDDPLAALPSFPVQRFQERPFIMPEGAGSDYSIQRILSAAGGKFPVRLSVMDDYTILSMVKHGLGCSILPRLILEEHHAGVATLSLDPPVFRSLGVAMMPGYTATPAARRFLRYAMRMFGDDRGSQLPKGL